MIKITRLSDLLLPQVVAIEALSFTLPNSEAVFRHDEKKYLVAKQDNKVLGYIGLEDIAGEKHIINMAVHPDYRRQGVGKKLVENILTDNQVFFLEVRPSNVAALELYKKYGFKDVGRRKNYYQDNGEDACSMKREPPGI